MNRTEEEQYDEEFPDHPLTKVRKLLAQLEQELVVRPELKKIRRFNK